MPDVNLSIIRIDLSKIFLTNKDSFLRFLGYYIIASYF